MSELFTTTPPDEEGWFFVQDQGCDASVRLRSIDADDVAWWCDTDEAYEESVLIKIGYLFGPRVPSASEYAELKEKARKWDLLDANYVDAGTGAICKYEKAIVDGTYSPVSYRISPENLERLNSLPSVNIIGNSWDNPTGDIPRDIAAINEAFTKLIGRE